MTNELGRSLPRGTLSAAWALILLATAFAGYQQLFCTFAEYDDEGYVMISLQSFLEGKPLYQQTFTQYGPAYYVLNGGLHRGFSLPINHEVTRFKTLLLWLGTAAASSLFIWRVTRSQGFAMAAFAAVFLHLDKLPLETGHPQELCALLVAGVLAVATIPFQERRMERYLAPIALGVLCGLVTMIKINVGVLLSLGTFLGLLACTRPSTLRTVAFAGTATAGVLLPLILFRDHLLDWKSNALPIVTVLSLVSGLVGARRLPLVAGRFQFPLGTSSSFLAASWLTMAWFAGAAVWSGTSSAALWHGLVGQHAGFTGDFFHSPPATPFAIPFALGIVWLMVVRRAEQRCFGVGRLAAVGLAAFSGIAYLLQSGIPPTHGMQERGAMGILVSFAPILLGLLLVPSRSDQLSAGLLARIVLVFVASLQTLTMFPTPGTQVAVGTFPLILGCLILGHDWLAQRASAARIESPAVPATRIAWALCGLFLAAILTRDVRFGNYRSKLTSLNLPGTGALKLPAETVREQRQIVETLRACADTFVFANHGRNSLYFWTDLRPPTAWNATFWRHLLRPHQQFAIVEALQRHSNACVVYENSPVTLPDGPLAEYIQGEFAPVYHFQSWQLWTRKSRPLPPVSPKVSPGLPPNSHSVERLPNASSLPSA